MTRTSQGEKACCPCQVNFVCTCYSVSDLPEAPAKLDWATYKNAIPIPGLVDKFQKEFESLKVPYPADNYTSKIDVLEKEVVSLLSKTTS